MGVGTLVGGVGIFLLGMMLLTDTFLRSQESTKSIERGKEGQAGSAR